MTPGRIWEKIQKLRVFTFKELEQDLIEEMKREISPVRRALLKNKIKYILHKSLQEGLLVKKGRKYYLAEEIKDLEELRKKIRSLPVETLNEILKIIYSATFKP